MSDTGLLDLVTEIVTAHVSNNTVAVGDIPGLIQSVHASLASLGQMAPPVEEQRTPAVSVRSSVKPHALTCLECGAKLKMLKRHLSTHHGLTPDDYRARWSLPFDYPLVAADYAAHRADLAVKIGLGRKPAEAVVAPREDAPKVEAEARKKAAAKAKSAVVRKPRKKLGLAFDAAAKATDSE